MSKRQALVTAMQGLLWERGFAATSPRDVLRRSNAGQGSLYHFVPSKEALAEEAMRTAVAEVNARTAATLGPDAGSGLERLERFVMSDRDPLRGCRLGRMTQDPELPERVRKSVADGFSCLQGVLEAAIDDAQREGTLRREVSSRALARLVLAAVQGGYVLSRAENSPEPMAEVTSAARAVLALLAPNGITAAPRKQGGKRASRNRRKDKERHAKPKPGL